MYAFRNEDGTIAVRPLRWPETKLSDGTEISPGDAGVTAELLASIGAERVTIVLPTLKANEVHDGYVDALIDDVPTRTYRKRAKTADELAAEADDAERQQKAVSVAQAIPWLRQQANQARSVNVTQTNAVNVLGALVTNVGEFYDHFADFLEARRHDQTGNNP